MTKHDSITDDNLRIMRFLYQYKHMTTADIHYYLFDGYNRRAVERRIKALLDRGCIDAYAQQSGAGRSARVYRLLLAGAREIGHDTLGNQHYRYERPEFRLFNLGLVELRHLAASHAWTLHEDEADCQQALYAYLRHNGVVDASLLMPRRIQPDLLLQTSDGALNMCIRAHPHAGRGFWISRIKKYRPVLHKCRAIAVVLDDDQAVDARSTVKRLGLDRRVLVTDLAGLRKLPDRIGRTGEGGRP